MAQKLLGVAASIAFCFSNGANAAATAAACKTTTLQSTTPDNGTHVALQGFSYCGGTLNATAYISNDDYDKVVTLYYTNAAGKATALSSNTLNYVSSISGTNFELWSSSTPIYYDGIQELLNITYQATDIGETYDQVLNKMVTASGAPAPTKSSPPAPYATPLGFADDVTEFLAVTPHSESETALQRMFLNINPAIQGAAQGVVVAARSGPSYSQTNPDYEYNWVRDSSLTMDVVQKLYTAATNTKAKAQYESVLFQYAKARATEQLDPNLQTGLGEPKFYLNNTIFSGPWGRPQNDGAATSTITLMNFANSYLDNGGDHNMVEQQIYNSAIHPRQAPVQKDLLFIAANWSSPSFDIWEEEESDHFYDKLVQRRALVMGIAFAHRMGDSATAEKLSAAAKVLTPTLNQFWDEGRQIVLYEYGPVLHDKSSYLDTAVILGIIHGYAGDGVSSYTNDQILSTAVRLATSFVDVFPIANHIPKTSTGVLGIPIGRYPEDVYNGTGTETNGGNPWFLCTAAMAEFMYAASAEYAMTGEVCVTSTSLEFFKYFAPSAKVQAGQTYGSRTAQFSAIKRSLNGWGDAFMRTIKHYMPSNGHLPEEFNRNTGIPQGAADLTWSYASVLTAAYQRSITMGEKSYMTDLANLGFSSNT